MVFKSKDELASLLKEDLTAQVVTSDGYRRCEIAQAWAALLNAKFRSGRWFGPAYSRIFDRIFLKEETPTGSTVYYDEVLSSSSSV